MNEAVAALPAARAAAAATAAGKGGGASWRTASSGSTLREASGVLKLQGCWVAAVGAFGCFTYKYGALGCFTYKYGRGWLLLEPVVGSGWLLGAHEWWTDAFGAFCWQQLQASAGTYITNITKLRPLKWHACNVASTQSGVCKCMFVCMCVVVFLHVCICTV